ncbi:hypothetical protein [Blastopirellula marina]|nr:hypothetical protein [Blastopirellula marina]
MIILPDLVAGCVTSEEFSDVSREVVNRFIDISLRSHEWLEVRPLLTDSFLERLRRGLLEVIPLAWEGRRVGKRSESVNGAFV